MNPGQPIPALRLPINPEVLLQLMGRSMSLPRARVSLALQPGGTQQGPCQQGLHHPFLAEAPSVSWALFRMDWYCFHADSWQARAFCKMHVDWGAACSWETAVVPEGERWSPQGSAIEDSAWSFPFGHCLAIFVSVERQRGIIQVSGLFIHFLNISVRF